MIPVMAKKRTRTAPTPDQLKAMLRKHLSFEINRFRLAASFWGKCQHDRLVDAMIRESCLIHFRLLLDFFYPRIDPQFSKHNDIFVSDFLPDPEAIRPEFRELLKEPPWLKGYRDQLDWRLAHLTLNRFQFEGHRWEASQQFQHVERLISLFLADLPGDLRDCFDPNRQG
jgi:hypothetical protein